MTIETDTLKIGLWLAGLMIAQFVALWKKLNKIELRSEHLVDFKTCKENRKECPCVKEFGALKERLITLEAKQ